MNSRSLAEFPSDAKSLIALENLEISRITERAIDPSPGTFHAGDT